jgi:hypothetical protein
MNTQIGDPGILQMQQNAATVDGVFNSAVLGFEIGIGIAFFVLFIGGVVAITHLIKIYKYGKRNN